MVVVNFLGCITQKLSRLLSQMFQKFFVKLSWNKMHASLNTFRKYFGNTSAKSFWNNLGNISKNLHSRLSKYFGDILGNYMQNYFQKYFENVLWNLSWKQSAIFHWSLSKIYQKNFIKNIYTTCPWQLPCWNISRNITGIFYGTCAQIFHRMFLKHGNVRDKNRPEIFHTIFSKYLMKTCWNIWWNISETWECPRQESSGNVSQNIFEIFD